MAIFDYIRLPRVTVTDSGQNENLRYTVAVEIAGIEAARSVTGEESLRGYLSFDPPTVRASTVAEAKRLAVNCCQDAIAATEGQALTPITISALSFACGIAISGAMVEEGIDG